MNHKQGIDRHQIQFVCLDDFVARDSFARVIDLLVDNFPLHELGFSHVHLNDQGNEPYHPATLLKLLLYGQRHGIRSARKLVHQCHINLEVKWLLRDLKPSHRTICYFRVHNGDAIKGAHRYFVKQLQNWKLISGEILALDSTKLRGQNSIKNNFNQKKINRHLEYIDHKIEEYLDSIQQIEESSKNKSSKEIENKIEKLEKRREQYKLLEQAVAESIDGQVSTTDPDSRAVIKHRNIIEVGYNAQTTVDAKHQIIVDVYAGGVNDRSDLATAARRAQDLLQVKHIELLADAGYHNGADIAYCERKGIRTFIPPSKKHHQKEIGYRKSDFLYDAATDTYTCPADQVLRKELTYKKRNSKRSYRVHRYGTAACAGCPFREKCTSAAAGRKIERPAHQANTERNDQRVKKYHNFYRLRQQIVEPVFGIWKRQWHMEYLILKTRPKVETELHLASLTYNLLRVVNLKGLEWLKNRLKSLFLVSFQHRALHGTLCRNSKVILTFISQHSRSLRTADFAS